jgi:hypothetical protein
MQGELVLSAALLSTFTLEGVKYLLRMYILKNPEFDFATIFYDLMIPFLTAAWSIGLGYAGWADMPSFTWEGMLQWALTVVISLLMYQMGIKPYKEYRAELKAKNG